jgi:hypothetical protein
MLLRPLARIVLGVTTVLGVLVGVVGVRSLGQASPRSMAELVEGVEAAGLACGQPMQAGPDAGSVLCDDGTDVVDVSWLRPVPGTSVRYSGAYVPLDASVATLSGDTFSVTGPYALLRRVQDELGGELREQADQE